MMVQCMNHHDGTANQYIKQSTQLYTLIVAKGLVVLYNIMHTNRLKA